MWTVVVNHTLQLMVSGEFGIYGWTDEVMVLVFLNCDIVKETSISIFNFFFFLQGVLLELTKKNQHALKVYGTNIKYFTFIKPTDETAATINEKSILQLWDVATGNIVNFNNNF